MVNGRFGRRRGFCERHDMVLYVLYVLYVASGTGTGGCFWSALFFFSRFFL